MTRLTVCRPLVEGGRIAILTAAERGVERTAPPLDKSTLARGTGCSRQLRASLAASVRDPLPDRCSSASGIQKQIR